MVKIINFLYTYKEMHYLSIFMRFRDEAKWLREWIEYHLLVGVDHFYLMDHCSVDHPEEVLHPYIQRGLVTLHRWDKELPPAGKHAGIFVEMGNSILANHRHETTWLAIIDSDEFLVPAPTYQLKDLLREYEQYPALAVNWQMFGTSQVEKIPDDRLMTELLLKRAPRDYVDNGHVKVIIQPQRTTGLKIHEAHYTSGHAVNTNKTQVLGPHNRPILTDKLRLHHYVLRDRHFMRTTKMARRKAFGWNPELVFTWEKEMNKEVDVTMLKYTLALRAKVLPPPWQSYLQKNPDLVREGITTKELAHQHWFNFGRYENRVF